jgi:hypothetical protein
VQFGEYEVIATIQAAAAGGFEGSLLGEVTGEMKMF